MKMIEGTDEAYRLARKLGVRVGWGSDTLFDQKLATRQGAQLAKLKRWFTPVEVLKVATGDNAQLLGLSGPRSPYAGRIGVIEKGALADLLLVDGDPTVQLDLIADPEKNFLIIMKDGAIYKNNVP
jgi:imidazolonepropionase-like amidohydrolase